jgi:hypothetical protein
MVFGHSWKASSAAASSPPPSSSAAAATTADNTTNTNNNNNMRPSSWMSPSSYSSSTTSHQPHPSVSVFGILSPADAGGGGGSGGQQQQPPPYPSAFIASGGGLYSQSNPHYSSLGSGGGGISTTTAAAAAGTTTMPPDFESLLVNSASLLSSVGRRRVGGSSSDGGATTTSTTTGVGVGGGGGGRSMMMTMMMMGGGASGIGNENTTTSSYEAEASAHRLLAREGWGFDSADLGRRARELERKVAANSSGGGGEIGGSRRSRNAWNDDDDDAQEEKKSSSGGTFDGMNDYYYGNNEPSSSQQQHQSMTLQELLTSHHNYCVEKAIRSSRERANKLSQQRMEERLQSDWMQRKQEVLGRGKVGHRFLLGSSSSSNASGSGGGGFNSGGGIGIGNELVPMIGNGAEGMNAASATGTLYSGIVPSPQLIPSSAERLVKSHLASIDGRLATMTTTTTTTATAPSTSATSANAAALSLLSSLEEGLKDVALAEGATAAAASTGTITPECLSGYSNAFSLIRSIVNCRIGLNASSSSSSSSTSMMMIPATMAMTYNANNTTPDIAPAVASNVMGTCHFFAQQFASHVREVVQEAELGGWTMLSLNMSDSLSSSSTTTTAARDICAFATLTVGKEVVDGRGGIWPRLFYCEFETYSQYFHSSLSSHIDLSLSLLNDKLLTSRYATYLILIPPF